MAKTKIHKQGNRWVSTQLGYGFSGEPRVRYHDSHADAIRVTGTTSLGGGTRHLEASRTDWSGEVDFF